MFEEKGKDMEDRPTFPEIYENFMYAALRGGIDAESINSNRIRDLARLVNEEYVKEENEEDI